MDLKYSNLADRRHRWAWIRSCSTYHEAYVVKGAGVEMKVALGYRMERRTSVEAARQD